MNIVLKELKLTCGACPTIFEGVTSDDKKFWPRFRYGGLTILIDDFPIFSRTVSNSLDGFCDFEDVVNWAEKENIHISVNCLWNA